MGRNCTTMRHPVPFWGMLVGFPSYRIITNCNFEYLGNFMNVCKLLVKFNSAQLGLIVIKSSTTLWSNLFIYWSIYFHVLSVIGTWVLWWLQSFKRLHVALDHWAATTRYVTAYSHVFMQHVLPYSWPTLKEHLEKYSIIKLWCSNICLLIAYLISMAENQIEGRWASKWVSHNKRSSF